MKIENLERLSKQNIEEKAKEVLLHYNSEHYTKVKPTPIEKVVLNLVENYPTYKFLVDDSLGYESGKRILGCYSVENRTIYVDSTLKSNQEKFHFVLGHELGHLILHRNVSFANDDKNAIIDTEYSFEEKGKLITDLDFMEWQANYFAAAILLPYEIFCSIVKHIQVKIIGVAPWRGRIHLDDTKDSRRDYQRTIDTLVDFFKVSKAVVEIRLRELDLINDVRTYGRFKDPIPLVDALINTLRSIDSDRI